ncbi:hypothetical protein BTJ40_09940 [Microbulbifer sp. A4B17]|uniref:hypothetical protein n=1 Tax=Microbulbifer sp. A4B17 TaxID=359370 RepID=UPI000D52DDF3|nr:hypothetical protein [Microbulbifer sp. A4B17]AWF81110.1 hypothetical protein BTJ40_09940 [Microbulbifer sp. A4B17]
MEIEAEIWRLILHLGETRKAANMELQSNKIPIYIFGGFILTWLLVSLSFALDGGSAISWGATILCALLAAITFSFKTTHYIDGDAKSYTSKRQALWHSWTETQSLAIFKGVKIISYSPHSSDRKSNQPNWQVMLIFRHSSVSEGIQAQTFSSKEDAVAYANELALFTALPLLD